jgi:arginase
VDVTRVERGTPFRDSVSASLAVCRVLAHAVEQAIADDALPVVLAGGCDSSKGILSGFAHDSIGVVWFDAHADFNTPESTVSGYFPGMSLAVITGHCYRNAWAQIGNADPIRESAIVLVGVRDVDGAEQDRLDRSEIGVVPWRDGKPGTDLMDALDRLAGRVREIYLHVDIDVLDPAFAPGVVDRPAPGGLSLEQLETAVRGIADRFRVQAIDLAVYNPERDIEDRTLRSGLRVIEVIGECVAQPPPARRTSNGSRWTLNCVRRRSTKRP